MKLNTIKEYLNKGTKHYEDIINGLNVKNEKSTKYMYNKGALDALNNMLLFINQPPKEENKEEYKEFTHISYKKFTGVIPTSFEYPKEVYESFIKNSDNLVLVGDKIVGKFEANVVGNLIYLKGIIQNIYPKEGFSNIKLVVNKDKNFYNYKFELGEGQKNFEVDR